MSQKSSSTRDHICTERVHYRQSQVMNVDVSNLHAQLIRQLRGSSEPPRGQSTLGSCQLVIADFIAQIDELACLLCCQIEWQGLGLDIEMLSQFKTFLLPRLRLSTESH